MKAWTLSTCRWRVIAGYSRDCFPESLRAVHVKFNGCTELSKGIMHTFFVVEAKSDGDFQEGVTQACRNGAAMVKAHRDLKAHAKRNVAPASQSFADDSTMAYSMVLCPQIATMYVHWAEVYLDRIIYHMHLAASYAIEEKENIEKLRAAINNVLDWGLGERKRTIEATLMALQKSQLVSRVQDSQGEAIQDIGVLDTDSTSVTIERVLEEEEQSPVHKRKRT